MRNGLLLAGALALLAAAAFLARGCPREPEPVARVRAGPPPVEPPRPAEPHPVAPPQEPNPPSEAPVAVAGRAADPGTIFGQVKVEGEVFPPRLIRMDGDPKCAELHGGVPQLREDLVVDGNRNLKWAFVCVAGGLEGRKFEAPAFPVLVDQVRCRFEPRVVGVMAGQPVRYRNGDDLLHNVHALPFNNREFNFGQARLGDEDIKTFTLPERMVKVKCDIHPWMVAWVGVVDHPFFAVTDDGGRYALRGLPPGRHTLEVWHEKYETERAEVELPSGGQVERNLVLRRKKE